MNADRRVARVEPAIPLWRQLQAAASVLQAVRRGESATPSLDAIEAALRPGVQALAYHALRELGRAEAIRRQLAPRKPPADVDSLLCAALALAWDPSRAPYAPFTLVDQTVEAAKRTPAMRQRHAFVNACLRRFLRERDALVAATDRDPVAQWNHPAWWIERVRADHPAQWQAVLLAARAPAPLTLRVNARRATVAQVQDALTGEGIGCRPVGGMALQLDHPRPVPALPGYAQGLWSVQDAGAQLAAPLVAQAVQGVARPRLLDACAAPGGKTSHLLELCEADLLALDVDAARCRRIHDNLARLGLQAEVRAADAGEPAGWWDGRPFDAILLDAPCTASGIVRRHPDVPWLRRASDVARLAAQQDRLLAALWPLLRPGGVLVYCTCSVFRAEGEERMAAFVAHNREALRQPAPGHLTPQTGAPGQGLPDNGGGDHDGFFYAVLRKRAPDVPLGAPAG